MKNYLKYLIAILAITTLAACQDSTTKDQAESASMSDSDSTEQTDSETLSAAEQAASDCSSTDSQGNCLSQEAVQKKLALLEVRTFYFNYDEAELMGVAFDALEAHASAIMLALQTNSQAQITIEGHADERGTIEYNNALGNNRAEAVARFLRIKGVPQENINVVSYGELRPIAEGHDEEAWGLNRRAVIIY